MGSEVDILEAELHKRSVQIFKDFLTGVAKLEQLGAVGSQFLDEYQQALEFIRRPPINVESRLVANIIKDNETERLKSYIARGCIKDHDRMQSWAKLTTCELGLREHLSKAKSILNELHSLVDDLVGVLQTANNLLPLEIEKFCNQFDQQAKIDQGGTTSSNLEEHKITYYVKDETTSSDVEELKIKDYAALMAIIYAMVKQDYVMREKIVTCLSLKTSTEELESYCMLWSLHPYIDDEVMHEAWSLIN